MKSLKNTMFSLALTMPVAAVVIIGCQTQEENIDSARDKVQEAEQQVDVANQELDQVLNDSIQLFKKESGEIIFSYEKSIAEIKTKLENKKEEDKIALEKKLALLEQKNNELKIKLEEYQAISRENWDSFKTEFKHDLNELGAAFKGLTVSNVK